MGHGAVSGGRCRSGRRDWRTRRRRASRTRASRRTHGRDLTRRSRRRVERCRLGLAAGRARRVLATRRRHDPTRLCRWRCRLANRRRLGSSHRLDRLGLCRCGRAGRLDCLDGRRNRLDHGRGRRRVGSGRGGFCSRNVGRFGDRRRRFVGCWLLGRGLLRRGLLYLGGLFGLLVANEPLTLCLPPHAVALRLLDARRVAPCPDPERAAEIECLLVGETELLGQLVDADLGRQRRSSALRQFDVVVGKIRSGHARRHGPPVSRSGRPGDESNHRLERSFSPLPPGPAWRGLPPPPPG